MEWCGRNWREQNVMWIYSGWQKEFWISEPLGKRQMTHGNRNQTLVVDIIRNGGSGHRELLPSSFKTSLTFSFRSEDSLHRLISQGKKGVKYAGIKKREACTALAGQGRESHGGRKSRTRLAMAHTTVSPVRCSRQLAITSFCA